MVFRLRMERSSRSSLPLACLMSALILTDEDLDRFMDGVLECDSPTQYDRFLVKFGKEFGRDPKVAMREGDQLLRRRANRRSEYSPVFRKCRTGVPFTYAENRILRWAFDKTHAECEGKESPTVEYIASLLSRETEEVSKYVDERHKIRHSIEGWF